jgi:S1-C subfamily serine protease
MSLKDKIEKIKTGIVAIGFQPEKDKISIIGSGFAVGENGEILTAAHLNIQSNQKPLFAMAVTKEEKLEYYNWFPIKLTKKADHGDLALYRMPDYKKTLLKKIPLGNSENVYVGDDAYFIGFPYAAQLINEGFGISRIVNRTVISSVKRAANDPKHPQTWIFADAISNPGNSGCPLISTETNKAIGVMTISFRTRSKVKDFEKLDIREPMHIAGAMPINLAKRLLVN